jgi:hypothetical protein
VAVAKQVSSAVGRLDTQRRGRYSLGPCRGLLHSHFAPSEEISLPP